MISGAGLISLHGCRIYLWLLNLPEVQREECGETSWPTLRRPLSFWTPNGHVWSYSQFGVSAEINYEVVKLGLDTVRGVECGLLKLQWPGTCPVPSEGLPIVSAAISMCP